MLSSNALWHHQDLLSYKISRTPTLGFHSGYDIVRHFHAPRFETALREFLTSESPSLIHRPPPQLLSALYPVFRQFSVVLPSHHGQYDTDSVSRIRATPAHKRQDAHYDTVLVRKELGQQVTRSGVGLHGTLLRRPIPPLLSSLSDSLLDCRVARVRLIFSLPPHLQHLRAVHHEAESHLAYVEWFTPFLNEPEPVSGLYRTSRSFVQQQTHASIVPVTSILRSCHLIPVWGEYVDRHWMSSTVLDVCDDFHLNTFSDHDMYSFIHLNSNVPA